MEYTTKEAVQKCLDDLSRQSLIGNENDTFISLAEAKDRIEELPTADVAPKSEVAREIFEYIDDIMTDHAQGYIDDHWLYVNIEKLKKKYREGKE